MWGRPDGGLDTHPAPPHTRTHSYTHTRSTSAAHTPSPATFFTHPLAHLTLHTSLLTARSCARLANRMPGRQSGRLGLLNRLLCEDTHPHLHCLYLPPPQSSTPESLPSGGALCPHPSATPEHTHEEEYSSYPWPRATSGSRARSRVTANGDANASFE